MKNLQSYNFTDFVVDESALVQLMNLGFSRSHAMKGLRETGNNVERAADWVFNHPDEPDCEMMEDTANSKSLTNESPNDNEVDFRK